MSAPRHYRFLARLAQVSAVAVALLVAGCGADTADTAEGVDSPAPAAASGPATGSAASGDASPDPASGDATSGDATSGDTVTITDAQDREVEVPTNPETVVVMDWSVIRTLGDLGVEVDATPQPNGQLPEDLAAYTDGTTVGTLFEPDYEAISALQPDLIIIGSRSGNPEVLAEMEKISPTVIDMSARYTEASEQLDVTEQRVLELASIFGKTDRAQQRMDDIRASIEAVAGKAKDTGTAMFVQVSGGTVSAYGPGSRFGMVFSDFGFSPIDAPLDDEGGHGDEISQEFFTQYNPDAVFVLDRAKATGSDEQPALEILNNELVNATDAAKNNKLIEVDGFSWYLATAAPSSLEQMVADMEKAF